ncbi:MAG: glycoside hydrolase family 127 protein [Planctomycetota bacterium]
MYGQYRIRQFIVLLAILTGLRPVQAVDHELVNTSRSPYVRVRNVDLDAVRWTEGFWADKFELCRSATLPSVHKGLLNPLNSEHLINFKIAAGLEKAPRRSTAWSDGDCYKWLEAVALVYQVTRDPELDRLMDEWIDIIAKAQAPDGYIATQIGNDTSKRLKMPHIHELYCMGHLLTAACIHHRVTGKDSFLAIARKTGDFLYEQFQPRPPRLVHFPWNPSAYMGLIELYRTTRDRRYLELAEILINNRGSSPGGGDHRNGGTDQTQDRVPLRKETQAVGHAVCATYLYCGAADLFAETGDITLLNALQRIWLNVTTRKMYITGAVGAGGGVSARGDPLHEAFLDDYELPNRSAYNETCSNIGNAMWNWRMLALTGDAKYADIMERVLYNSMLSTVSADGKKFFYCNPLKWTGEEKGPHKHHTATRWSIHSCYCCPPQVARTIAGLSGWAYGVSKEELWIHLYGGSTIKTRLPDGTEVSLEQETKYPWNGHVAITFQNTPDRPISLKLRIPAWTEGATLKINARHSRSDCKPGSYTTLRRRWSAGDKIELELPLKVRLIEANPRIGELRNAVAVMRGPIVYCLELPKKQNGQSIWNDGIFLSENVHFKSRFDRDRLGGITVLTGRALNTEEKQRFARDRQTSISPRSIDWTNQLYRRFESRPLNGREIGTVDIELIPYFAWANRGVSWMEVWIPLAR